MCSLRGSRHRFTARRALVGVALLGLTACAPTPAHAPNPVRELAEERAITVIAEAVRAEGGVPGPGRDETLLTGKSLHVDVGVEGHRYGIAYITIDEATRLGAAIPPAGKADERLHLVRAGNAGTTQIVLLYQEHYVFDDQTGEAHEHTAITCENQLARDTRDFILHAETEKFR